MTTSVALCTYNGERFLAQQLDSIINQTIQVDEIIICDDNSTDLTACIVSDYIKKYSFIKFLNNTERLGTIRNFEKAISFCSGECIFLSDQDDIWKKDKVEKTLCFFKIHHNCLLFFTDGELIDKDNNKLLNKTLFSEWNFTSDIKKKWRNNNEAVKDLINGCNKVTGAAACLKKELKKDILPIRVPQNMWHDAWIALHAAKRNGLFFVDTPFIDYRIHEEQQVGVTGNRTSQGIISMEEYRVYLKKNFGKYYKYYNKREKSIWERIISKIRKIFNEL